MKDLAPRGPTVKSEKKHGIYEGQTQEKAVGGSVIDRFQNGFHETKDCDSSDPGSERAVQDEDGEEGEPGQDQRPLGGQARDRQEGKTTRRGDIRRHDRRRAGDLQRLRNKNEHEPPRRRPAQAARNFRWE